MNIAMIKEQLHHYIDEASSEKLKAIHTLVISDINNKDLRDDAFYDEMDRRVNDLESGAVKGMSWEEAKQAGREALKTK